MTEYKMKKKEGKLQDEIPLKCDKCKKKLEYKKSKTATIDYDADRAVCSCGNIYEINKTTGAVYMTENKGGFIHRGCGEEVDCVWRTHSVWDGLFPCSGSGEVDRYPIPFCAEHEEEPSSTGLPIEQ